MRTFGDQPRAASHLAGSSVREPGAELVFPGCACPVPPLDVDAVRFLSEVQVATVLEAARSACLHRCPALPRRRRDRLAPEGAFPVTDLE